MTELSTPAELTRDIIRRFGGQKALAEFLSEGGRKIGPSAVSNWPLQGGVPGKYHLRILALADEREVDLTGDELLSTTRRR